MKRRFSKWIAAALCAAVVGGMMPVALGSQNNTAEGKGPTSADTTRETWAVRIGSGSAGAAAVTGDAVYAAEGDVLYKLDPSDGSVVKQSPTMEADASQEQPEVGDGMVFVRLSDGRVQAFDEETLDSLWVSEELGGEGACPITYHDGKIYTGTSDGAYVCLTTEDEDTGDSTENKECLWKTENRDGYNGAGAYATDEAVVFGSETGTLYSVNPEDGTVLDSETGLDGAIRSAVIGGEDGAVYFTASQGTLYRVPLESDGTLGEAQSYELGGPAAAAPTVLDGRIYVSVSGTGTTGSLKVMEFDETDGFTQVYSVETNGSCVQAPLAVTVGGGTRIYYTTDDENGSLYSFLDKSSSTAGEAETLYTPEDGKKGAGLGTVTMSNNVVYYQTTAGMFALTKKAAANSDPTPEEPDDPQPTENLAGLSKVSASRRVKDTTTGSLSFKVSEDATVYYKVTAADASQPNVFRGDQKDVSKGTNTITLSELPDDACKVWIGVKNKDGSEETVKSADIAATVTTKLTFTPETATVTVKHGSTKIDAVKSRKGTYTYQLVEGETYRVTASADGYETASQSITAKASKTEYDISLNSKNSKLEQLSVSLSQTNANDGFTLDRTFDPAQLEYTAKTDSDPATVYIWLRKSDSTSSCHVYGESGVSSDSMRKNKSLIAESYNGYQRYSMAFASGRSMAKLSIEVKAADGSKRTYTLKVKKSDKTAPVISCTSAQRVYKVKDGVSTLVTELKIQSSEKATGYLKVSNPGVVPNKMISEGYQFALKKGETVLDVTGLRLEARDLYVVAQDAAGNNSTKLKISIAAYTSGTTTNNSTSTNNSTTTNNTTSTTTNSSSTTTTNSGTATMITQNTTDTTTTDSTSGTTIIDPSEDTIQTTTDTTETTGDIQLWNSADGSTLDTGETDSGEAVTVEGSAAAGGDVPANSVISRGVPTWSILLVIVLLCGGGVAGYWFVIRRGQGRANK